MEEIQWNEAPPIFDNIAGLFDLYYNILSLKNPSFSSLKVKTEMILNAIMTQLQHLQLLPDILVK